MLTVGTFTSCSVLEMEPPKEVVPQPEATVSAQPSYAYFYNTTAILIIFQYKKYFYTIDISRIFGLLTLVLGRQAGQSLPCSQVKEPETLMMATSFLLVLAS